MNHETLKDGDEVLTNVIVLKPKYVLLNVCHADINFRQVGTVDTTLSSRIFSLSSFPLLTLFFPSSHSLLVLSSELRIGGM